MSDDDLTTEDEEEDCAATLESAAIIQWRECSVIVERICPEIKRETMKEGVCRIFLFN